MKHSTFWPPFPILVDHWYHYSYFSKYLSCGCLSPTDYPLSITCGCLYSPFTLLMFFDPSWKSPLCNDLQHSFSSFFIVVQLQLSHIFPSYSLLPHPLPCNILAPLFLHYTCLAKVILCLQAESWNQHKNAHNYSTWTWFYIHDDI